MQSKRKSFLFLASIVLLLLLGVTLCPAAAQPKDLGTLGGSYSEGRAINASGQVTGYAYTTEGERHAFRYVPGGNMEDLGTLGGSYSEGRAINASGQVTGYSYTSGGGQRAFRYVPGGSMEDLGTLGGSYSEGRDINASGQIIGVSTTASGEAHAFLWTPGGTDGVQGNAQMKDLGTVGGSYSEARAINDSGQVTGYSYTSGDSLFHAFLWTPGGTDGVDGNTQMKDLGTLGGNTSDGFALNASGQVTGLSYTSEGVQHAFRYVPGVSMEDLGTLGGSYSEPAAINASGQITGYSYTTSTGREHAFLWTPGGTDGVQGNAQMKDLGTVGGGYSGGIALNDSGQVTGWSTTLADSDTHAFRYTPGTGMEDLGTLGGSSSHSNAINASGIVTGYADAEDWSHACVWGVPPITTATLTPPPNAAGWNRQITTVLLQATDNDGVQSITYSASGAQTIPSTTVFDSSVSVEIYKEGSTTLTFHATNVSGSKETSKSVVVKLDKTAPLTNASLSGGKVSLSASDSLSGVQATYYSLNGGATQTYSASFDPGVGVQVVEYWSVDVAGNEESHHTVSVSPTPSLLTLSPNNANQGSGSFILLLEGVDFAPDAQVYWNGAPRKTTVFSTTQAAVYILASDLAQAGTASITLVNPALGGGMSNSLTFTITAAVNHAPVANGQSVTTTEDTAKAITLSGSDVDGDSLTYSIVSGPSHGTLSGTGANRTYTPAANYNGSDSFTFKVDDGHGGTSTATVNITVTPVNDNPVANADTASTKKNTAATISVLANDTDADGDLLTISSFTQPANGSVVKNANNTFTFTPAKNFIGTTTFTYTISDGHGGSATATVTVTVGK